MFGLYTPWRRFYRIEDNALFWINRQRWPQDIDVCMKLFDRAFARYRTTCGSSFLDPETTRANCFDGVLDAGAMEGLVVEFRMRYGSTDDVRIETGVGQVGQAVITVVAAPSCDLELFPVYFRGVTVKAWHIPSLDGYV